ncbi:hypothetical protein C8A00DRAFT_36068 [Chaetomidium leptoderma]|uniref:Uncharacterized protein n=1 Tax=Chaetomidium leptoderma TaxID=669021 RepID=A0AAN6ZWC7_9PEZI|nr:hypothetical protein C8A00DRAFT_36068 [Chaetomidium leptoderma]
MGSLFSKEKHRSRPSSSKGSGGYQQPIDPRDQQPQRGGLFSGRRGNNTKAAAKRKPQYHIDVQCTHCDHDGCVYARDIMVNACQRTAYTTVELPGPHNGGSGPLRKWTVQIDFCGFAGYRTSKTAQEVLRRHLGDRTYRDGETLKSVPFCAEALVADLRAAGVPFDSRFK